MDPRYLHPAKHNCAACQGPATGGKDLLLLIVALFGKRELFLVWPRLRFANDWSRIAESAAEIADSLANAQEPSINQS